jgi:hypothetical protein
MPVDSGRQGTDLNGGPVVLSWDNLLLGRGVSTYLKGVH